MSGTVGLYNGAGAGHNGYRRRRFYVLYIAILCIGSYHIFRCFTRHFQLSTFPKRIQTVCILFSTYFFLDVQA